MVPIGAPHALANPALFPNPAALPPEAQQVLKANAATLAATPGTRNMHDPKLRRRLKLATTPVLALWGERPRVPCRL